MKFFKKFLMPCGLCAAVPAMKPPIPEEHPAPCSNEIQGKKLIKPSELPIYSIDDGYTKQMPCIQYPSIVEDNIRKIRQTVSEIKLTIDKISRDISSSLESLKFISDYLQDQANLMPRIGAVGVGGLSGLILSLRGGIFKRLMYTTTGAAIVGCVCFPKETKETVNTMEHYGNVSYNFIYGVLAEAHDISFHHNKEDLKPLDSITPTETSPIEVQNSKTSKSLIK